MKDEIDRSSPEFKEAGDRMHARLDEAASEARNAHFEAVGDIFTQLAEGMVSDTDYAAGRAIHEEMSTALSDESPATKLGYAEGYKLMFQRDLLEAARAAAQVNVDTRQRPKMHMEVQSDSMGKLKDTPERRAYMNTCEDLDAVVRGVDKGHFDLAGDLVRRAARSYYRNENVEALYSAKGDLAKERKLLLAKEASTGSGENIPLVEALDLEVALLELGSSASGLAENDRREHITDLN